MGQKCLSGLNSEGTGHIRSQCLWGGNDSVFAAEYTCFRIEDLGKRAVKPDEYKDTETQRYRDTERRDKDTLYQMQGVAHSIN